MTQPHVSSVITRNQECAVKNAALMPEMRDGCRYAVDLSRFDRDWVTTFVPFTSITGIAKEAATREIARRAETCLLPEPTTDIAEVSPRSAAWNRSLRLAS